MFEVASQIIICLILAALLGGIIGYLIGRASCDKRSDCNKGEEGSHLLHIDQQNNQEEFTEEIAPIQPQELGTQPMLLTAPREGGKDNLQLIKGVGKVLEGVLNEIGIYHFDQIANLTKEEITWLDTSMAFPGRIEREEWVAQAKLFAQGETTEFAQRVERGEVTTSKKSD